MTGKTISSLVTTSVTLGSAGYPSPLTITSTGRIAPSVYGAVGILLPSLGSLASIVNQGAVSAMEGGYGRTGGVGGNGIDLNSPAVLTNSGVIAAGVGGYSNYNGGLGGTGLDVQASSTVVNSGQIFGGTGGYGFYTPGIAGGGVVLDGSATLSNTGLILGGTGGRSNSYNVYAYRTITGGIGVSTGSEAVVSNTGHITGGAGGYTDQSSTYQIVGNSGAAGVALGAASTLSNGGTITGGMGGVGGVATYTIQGGNGGEGADLAAATATNTGLIAGGAGNYGFLDGGNGGAGVYVSAYGAFTNKGNVVGGAGGISNVRYGGAGGIGLAVSTYATATNSGHITGGAGGAGGNQAYFGDGGLQGGAGAYVLGGKLVNTATITGGAGGATPGDTNNNGVHHDNGGYGGAGIQLGGYFTSPGGSNLSAINYGLVRGGVGGNITSYEGTAGVGGAGAFVLDGIFTNHGSIFGGAGGGLAGQDPTDALATAGGVGVRIDQGASLLNTGTIQGGTGGVTVYTGANGGGGVYIAGGTFTDSGVVRGGYGGTTEINGARGDAIYMGGSIGGTLILNAGAVLVGNVVAHAPAYSFPAVKDVLEVAGSSATPLAGFGTQITGFNVVGFAPGAVRTLEGTFGGGTDIVGFAPHDSIVLDGFVAIAAETSLHAPYLELANAGTSISLDLSLAQSKDLIITAAGGKTTIASAVQSTSYTIGSNMAQLVASGGGATGSVIKAGGEVTINQGGEALHPTIAGGTLQLEIGGLTNGGIGFSTVTGGELILDSAKMPAATISGFIAGDTIKLAGVVYNGSDTVTVATAGVVTVKTPGGNFNLDIAGATVGESDFHFGTGSLLTKTAAKTMTFLSPRDAWEEPGVFGHGAAGAWDLPRLAGADWFGGAERLVEPAGAAGFTPPPAPALAHGIGQAFTISGDVKLESLGLGHHSSWLG